MIQKKKKYESMVERRGYKCNTRKGKERKRVYSTRNLKKATNVETNEV